MSLGRQALNGAFWTYTEKFGAQVISFGVSILMARMLHPSEFGLIGMLTVFIALGQTLIDSGLTQSLIREKEPTQKDYSTVFIFNLTGSIIVYLLIYLAAPYISKFYEQEQLINITRIYCLSFIINAFSTIQITKLTKELNFKTQLLVSLPSLIISSAFGLFFAIKGFGVWSLVYMYLIQSTLKSLQFWFHSKWRPSLVFDKESFLHHFEYGYKLGLSGMISSIFSNIYPVIIGKFFSPASLGFYDRANAIRNVPLSQLISTLNKVTFPLFAKINEDDMRLKNVYKQIMQTVIFFIAPVMLILSVLSEPVILFLLSDKWLPSAEYMQILCIAGILSPFHIYNLNILKVKGRSDLFLKLEIIKRIIIILTLVISIQFGVIGVIWGQIINSVIFLFINSYYSGKLINYSLFQQIKDISLYIFMAVIMGAVVYGMNNYFFDKSIVFVKILIPGLTGMIFYFGLLWVFNVEAVKNIKNLMKSK